jgi:hypothetical protein
MKRYNINTKRTYEKNGEEKTAWLRVGSLAHFPAAEDKEDSFIMELSMFPHTKFFIFADKKKEEKAEEVEESAEINPDDVPF